LKNGCELSRRGSKHELTNLGISARPETGTAMAGIRAACAS
jgi:hypothetical protein